MCGVVMTCGKTLDGAHDIEADNLIVNESSDLKGFTTVDGPSTFTQDIDLQNSSNLKTITLSASDAQENYTINLPSIKGTAGQFFTTDGLGNTQWSSVTPTVAGVSYIALVGIDNFIKVNGQASDSTYTSKTFNLELSGILPIAHGGTGLSSAGTADQVLSSNGGSMVWKTSSGAGLNILQTSPTLITPILGAATGTSLTLSSLTASYSVHTDASKNLVSVQNSGTGLNILQTSPTLITPTLGAASGTSLNLSSLTASRLLLSDASNNLVSLSSAGTTGQILTVVSGSPTWANPATSGTVTSVSLTVPSIFTVTGSPITSSGSFAISTATAPTGSGNIVLSNNPAIYNPYIQLQTTNQIIAIPFGAESFKIRKATDFLGRPVATSSLPPTVILFYSVTPKLPDYRDFVIQNAVVVGPVYRPYEPIYPGAITIRTGDFYEVKPLDSLNTNTYGPGRNFLPYFFPKGAISSTSNVYTDGHPLKDIPASKFFEYEGALALYIDNPRSYIRDPVTAFDNVQLSIKNSQFEGVYHVYAVDDKFIVFENSDAFNKGVPNAPITVYDQDGVGMDVYDYGDIELFATGRGVFSTNWDLDLKSLKDIYIGCQGNMFLTAKKDIKLSNVDGQSTFESGSFNFYTPEAGVSGGIDSFIFGTIAWNAFNDFEALAFSSASLSGYLGTKVYSGQHINLIVDNIGVNNPVGQDTLIDIVPVSPFDGNINLTCSGTFFVPLANTGIDQLTKTPVGGIYLKASDTGIISLKGGNQGVFIETKEYFHSVLNIPTGNQGLVVETNNGKIKMTTTADMDLTSKRLILNSYFLTIRPGLVDLIPNEIEVTDVGEITCNSLATFNQTFKVKKVSFVDTAGAGLNGALFSVEASDWQNGYTGGTCPFWTASNFGSVRLVGTSHGGVVNYTTASTVYIDEPTEGNEKVIIDNLYALFVNGKSTYTGNATFSSRIQLTSNFTELLTIGGNSPLSGTGFKLQNGDEQTLTFGVAGVVEKYSTQANQGDAVIRGDEDHNLLLQTGVGASAIKIDNNNLVVVRKGLSVLGNEMSENPCLVVGRVDNDASATSISLINDYTQDLTIGIAGSTETYSLSASKGDTVIRTHASRGLYLQSGVGVSRLRIDGSNNVRITVPDLLTPFIISTPLAILGPTYNIGINALESSATTVYHLFGNNADSPANYGRILTNYVSTGSSSNFISFGNTRSNISFSGDGTWTLAAFSYTLQCSMSGNVTHTGSFTLSSALGAVNFSTPSATITGLTASYSVHTDASKNLVSVQNSGTGLNILQTSPTLITPVLGAATGTSLNLSSLTASYSVQTDSSKNLVSVQNSGTGLNILQTSPTLITPTLGVASGTSLNLSGLTASRLLLSDDSKNLVSLPESSSYGGVLVDGKNKQQVTSVSSLDLFVPGGTSIYPTGTSVQTEGFTVSSGFPDSGVNRRWTVLGGDSTKITITTVPLYPLQSGAPLGTVKSPGPQWSNILDNSPTLVTPIIGAASGTSLNLSSLTASRLLLTDASKNLVSLSSAGTNGQILTIVSGAPTWSSPATSGILFINSRNCHFSISNSPINIHSHWLSNNFFRHFSYFYDRDSNRYWINSLINFTNFSNSYYRSSYRNIIDPIGGHGSI